MKKEKLGDAKVIKMAEMMGIPEIKKCLEEIRECKKRMERVEQAMKENNTE